MSYILCTAEKPSVAKEIARVLEATEKRTGYYEGNGYRVTWAVGHMVGLAEPDEYGYVSKRDIWTSDKNKKRALQELPVFPEQFKLVVLEPARQQFDIVKKLMNDPECREIVDCGDAGAEGHILQHFIRVKAGCRKPVKKFIATSMTDEAIRYAMENLQDIAKYFPVIRGEYCKKRADWILGMTLSRAASIMYNARVDVGRVQTPTLYYVVKRYIEHINFVPMDYYILKAVLSDGIEVFWKEDVTGLFSEDKKDSLNRLTDKSAADQLLQQVQRCGVGTVTSLDSSYKEILPPLLYDITDLERDGNIIYGYTAEQVLQAAQNLYEIHKITTYPRTDNRYITHDLYSFYKERIQEILSHDNFKAAGTAGAIRINQIIVDDNKVTDNHAIIITGRFFSYPLTMLSEVERNILNLIVIRMLEAASEKHVYKETIIRVTFDENIMFENRKKEVVCKGWTVIREMFSDSKDSLKKEILKSLDGIGNGIRLCIQSVEKISCKTTPPKLHTEASLLTMMENAGSTIENGKILKGKGIGTPATRATIIKQLFDKGYIVNQEKGKKKILVPTKQGISIIKVLPPDLYSPKITAEWELQIARIVEGEINAEKFMNDFKVFILEKLEQVLNHNVQDIDFFKEKIIFGKCPWCGWNVYEGIFKDQNNVSVNSVYCSNRNCRFSLRKDNLIFKLRTGKSLTSSQIRALMGGMTIESRCISKLKKEYIGKFRMINKNGYADVEFIMPGRN